MGSCTSSPRSSDGLAVGIVLAVMDSEPGRIAERLPSSPLRFLLVTTEGWRRLGELFRRERLSRRLTQADFGAAVGMSEAQVRNIENAYRDRYDQDTLWLVDIAMGWQSGSSDRVSRELEPIPETEPMMLRFRELWKQLTPEQRDAVVKLMEHLASG
jgi:transcriptional regulator with XRE-family HTH domain